MPSGDDLLSPQITLTRSFRFLGTNFSSIFVSINGVLIFSDSINPVGAQAFSTLTYAAIGPYWQDMDTSRVGKIYYKQTTNVTVLNNLAADLASTFGTMSLQWAFIASWINVYAFGQKSGTGNTFQVILTTDGVKSFIVGNYKNLTSFQNASIGCSLGDGVNFFQYFGSFTAQIVNVVQNSNVNKTGLYAFEVSSAFSSTIVPTSTTSTTATSHSCSSIINSYGGFCEGIF